MHRHPSLRGWGGSTFAALAVATFSAIAVAPPWDGDKIVFGETEQGRAFSLDSAASASGVYFRCPATLGGAGPLTLVAPAVIYGGGELLTPLAGSDGMAVTNCFSSSRSVFPQKSTWTTIWPNAVLADVSYIAGEVTGIWSGIGIYFPTTLVTFEKAADGLSATAQFHIMVASGVPRAFKLAFQQNGANVEAQILWAKYSGDPAKFGLDWDTVTSGTSNYNPPEFSTSYICITNLRGIMAPLTIAGPLPTGHMAFSAKEVVLRPAADMTISSTFSGTVDKLSIVGSKTSLDDAGPCVTFSLPSKNGLSARPVIVVDGIDVKTTTRQVLPVYYHLILTNNAVFTDTSPYGNGATFDAQVLSAAETNTVTISKGCKCLVSGGDWSISPANQTSIEFVVDGGELDLSNRHHYLNRLTLANGGRMSCDWCVIGYYRAPPLFTSAGEGPCVVDGCIRVAAPYSGTLYFVFDTRSDLSVTGGFRYYSGGGEATLLKKGPATLSIGFKALKLSNGTFADGAPNPLRIEEGRLLLAANDAFSRTNACALAGGSIDAGVSTNRLGVLTLDGSAAVAVGNGQLTFSDSSAAAWAAGAVLSVTGPDQFLKKGRIRFLPEGGHEGLSAAQLAAVRYNGDRHVKLDGEGWLRSYMPGITISVK